MACIKLYNPWVLNLLYTRMRYRCEALECWRRHYPHKSLTEVDQRRVICQQFASEEILYEVEHLLQLASAERFPIDARHANFDYILSRALFHLASYTEMSGIDSPIACEMKLHAVENEPLLREILLDYVEQHYWQRAGHYETEIKTRLAVLFNTKHVFELNLPSDHVVFYSRELVMTLVYRVLLEECLCACRQTCARLSSLDQGRCDAHKDRLFREMSQESRVKRLTRLAEQQHLLENLCRIAQEQQEKEFYGFALQASPTESLSLQMEFIHRQNTNFRLTTNPEPVERYIDVTPNGALVLEEKPTDNYRYVPLASYRHFYLHITRRFQFECHLLQSHLRVTCARRIDAIVDGTVYHKCCHICVYFRKMDALSDFYTQCEHFQDRSPVACEDSVEHDFDRAMSSTMVCLVKSATSLIFLTLHLVWLLFRESSFGISLREYCQSTDSQIESQYLILDLFQILDLSYLMEQLSENLARLSLKVQTDNLLRYMRLTNGTLAQQRQLALRIAMELVLLLGVCGALDQQTVAIEKFERSLSRHLVYHTENATLTHLRSTLVDIYVFYRQTLIDIKIY